MDQDLTFTCAGCGEENEIFIEKDHGSRQELVQDCAVCCRPMVVVARWNAWTEGFELEIRQEDRD
jgi:hypothetical protein